MNLRVFYHFIIVLGLSISLSGCFTLGTVEIEIIKPSRITIPANINSTLVINNCLLYRSSFKNDIQKGLFSLDTSTTQILVHQVNGLLNESPRFDTSIVIDEIYYRRDTDLMQPIDWDNIKRLGAQHNVDAVLSLEAFGIVDSVIRFTQYDGFAYSTYKSVVLYSNTLWRIYLVDEQRILERNIQRDTLFITELGSKKDYWNAIITPSVVQYLAEKIAGNISLKIADRIAPYWQPVEREFFINGSFEMQQAAQYAYNDNWRDAAIIWKSLTDSENKQLAGAACHNMALVCEVEGKFDIAEKWLLDSLKNYNNFITKAYLDQIRIRMSESKKLDEQFGVK